VAMTLMFALPSAASSKRPVADHPGRLLSGFCVEPGAGCTFP
jgi:hypothetical protein